MSEVTIFQIRFNVITHFSFDCELTLPGVSVNSILFKNANVVTVNSVTFKMVTLKYVW